MVYRETISDLLAGTEQYAAGTGGGNAAEISHAEYLRALKQANEKASPARPSPKGAPAANESKAPERRLSPRYKCEGSVEFHSGESDVRTWATMTDLSRSGCYVEMQAPFPQDSVVQMVIDVKGIRLRVKGVVRVSYAFLGMGIAFTEVSDHDRSQLGEVLTRLAAALVVPAAAAAPKAATPAGGGLSTVDGAATVGAVEGFFQTHVTMTRQQFSTLVRRIPAKPGV